MSSKSSSAKARRPAASTETSSTALNPRAVAIAWIVALSLVQLGGLTAYFPIGSWMDPHPFYTSSYALHFARSLISESALAHHFRFWSYSPALMAGYPAGTRTEPMGDAVALWLWICSGFSTIRSIGRAAILYKTFVIGLLVCVPASMAAATLWFGCDLTIAALAAGLGVFGTFNLPGLLMIRAGMFSFFAASFLCVAWSALLYSSRDRGTLRLLFVAISGAFLMYLHPMSAILLVPASVGCLVECDTPGRFLRIAAVTAGVFVLSLGWLLPIFLTRDIGVHFANWWKTPGTPIGALATLIRNRLPFPPLIMMVLVAYGASRVSLRRRFLIVWLTAIAIFALLAYFGSLLEFLTPLEPARFEVPFFAFATPVAAVGAHEIWRRTGQRSTTFRRTSRVAAAVVVVALALVSVASVLVETAAHGSIATTLPEQAQEIRGWVNASDRDSRLVLESGYVVDNKGGMAPPYFKSDVGLLWAIESGRELIGASPSEGFSTFSFVDVGNGVAFGRPLADWNPADLLKQLETYNVGAMIAWSTQTKQFLDQVQGVVQLQRSDPYAFFGVSGMHSFLMAGKAASVRSSQDCIEIKGAEPGRLILKYHYFKTLRVDPPIPMGPAPLDNGDPNAFIRVDNDAVRDIRIYNAGFTGWGRAKNACE